VPFLNELSFLCIVRDLFPLTSVSDPHPFYADLDPT
jgi:hypothetical protein